MAAIGVAWGYGTTSELHHAGADAIAWRPEELLALAGELIQLRR
jgi:phosphoglycolate phosphatase-like HAD superfamily hydrolase